MANHLGNIKIKVQIADRTYPLTVDSKDEAIVRKAAKEISEKVNNVINTISVRDNQDSISVVALEYATLYLKHLYAVQGENKTDKEVEQLLNQLSSEISLLEKAL